MRNLPTGIVSILQDFSNQLTEDELPPGIQTDGLPDALDADGVREFQDRLRVLHEVSTQLTRATSLDELCRRAVDLGRTALDFDRLGVWLVEADSPYLRGTYGTDENGNTRDEHDARFIPTDPWLVKAVRDHSLLAFQDNVPLNNHRSDVVGRGWSAMAVLWDGDQCLGYLAADNLFRQLPATTYDLEILRFYGSTIGHLCARRRAEETLIQERIEAAIQTEKVEMLTEFISNLSHDLKNPLAVIKANLYLIERLNDPEREKAKFEVIKQQTARLERLIEDVLTMSRLEHSGQYSFEPLEFNRLVEEISKKLRPEAEKKKQTVTLEPAVHKLAMTGIKSELERMVFKLLENAISYTPEGGAIILRTALEKDAVVFSVLDTGIGISAEELPRIFDHFYRTDPARSTVSGGTGLGLAIVRKIIEMHGGTIEVESQPGQGSTFRVKLPLNNPS